MSILSIGALVLKLVPDIITAVNAAESAAQTNAKAGIVNTGGDKLIFAKAILQVAYDSAFPNAEVPFDKLDDTLVKIIDVVVKFLFPKKA